MKNSRITELFIHPASSTPEEAGELITLCEQYPYSAILHALTARIAADHNSPDKNKYLIRAAVHAADRTRLKQYITTEEVFAGVHRTMDITENLPGKIESGQKEVDEIKIIASEVQAESPEVIPETSEVIVESPGVIPETPEVIVEFPDLKIETPEIQVETTEFDNSPATIHPQVITEDPVPQAREIKTPNLADDLIKNIEVYRQKIKEFEEALDQIFTPGTPQTTVTPTPDPLDSEEKFREIIKPLKKRKPTKKLAKEEQDMLINKFIEKESDLQKPAKVKIKDTEKKEDLSNMSYELSDEMATETLANIMINQGKLEKAIDIYRKLIWKIPQKKTYFATQIETLKEKIAKQ